MTQKSSYPLLTKGLYIFKKSLPILVFLFLVILFGIYSDYNLATSTGNLCVILFILANTYVPAKRLRFIYNFRNVAEDFNVFLTFHCLLNITAFFVCCIHCYVSNWVNLWLKIAVVLMGWLTVGGFLMKFKYSPTIKKGIYFLHTQQITFFILFIALLKGHYIF